MTFFFFYSVIRVTDKIIKSLFYKNKRQKKYKKKKNAKISCQQTFFFQYITYILHIFPFLQLFCLHRIFFCVCLWVYVF